MDFFEAVKQRLSYREVFGAREVSREELRKLVEAGCAAPSGCNRETTEFVIVNDEAMVKEIAGLNPTHKGLQSAKAFILCIIDTKPAEEVNFVVEDCAAAVENMLLAITAIGLASVWIDGWLRVEGRAEKIGKMVGLPGGKVVRVLLPVGAPTADVQRRPKKSFEQRAWFNKYKK